MGPKLVFLPIWVVNWVSSCLSFLQSTSTVATYILNASTCTTTIMMLKPYALMQSVNISYWDSIKFPYFANTAKRQDRGWKQAQIEVEDRVSLCLTLISTSNLVEVRTLLVTMKSMLQGWKCVEMFGFVHISLKLKKHVLKPPWTLHALCIGQMQHVSTSSLKPLFKKNWSVSLLKWNVFRQFGAW